MMRSCYTTFDKLRCVSAVDHSFIFQTNLADDAGVVGTVMLNYVEETYIERTG